MVALLMMQMMLTEGVFFKGSFDEVLKKAEQEEKLIVVDVYTTWCGPCKLMDRVTFSDQKVQTFLSEKMIGFKIDAEKGEGIALARKYRVMGYPCLLILDEDGKLVSHNLGFISAKDFLRWAGQNMEE